MSQPTSYLTTTYLAFNTSGLGTGGTDAVRMTAASNNTLTFSATAGTIQLKGVSQPSVATDAVNKEYVDNLVSSGITWKDAVQAASQTNIDLSITGDGTTIDGVALEIGDRVLIKAQTAGTVNGVYQVTAGAWVRTTDCSTAEQASGAAMYILGGTLDGGETWVCNTTSGNPFFNPVNFGNVSTPITFVQMSSNPAVAGAPTQIQYNDNGNFGADADFTYTPGTNTLAVTGGTISTTVLSASGLSSLTNLVSTGISASVLNATTITAGTLNASGLSSLQNVVATGVSATVLNATTITAGTLSVSGDSTLTNITSTNIVATNISVGTLNVANPVTFTSLTVSNLFVTSGSITNLVNTSATSGSLKVTGVLDAATITAGALNISGSSVLQGVSATVLNVTTITAGTLNASGLSSLQNLAATGVSATVLNATTITAGTLSVSGDSALTNVTSTNVVATNISVGTLNVANPVTFTSLTVSNLFVTSGSITNLVNTSATSGSLKVTGVLDATTITAGTLSVSGNSALTNVTSTNVVATNISVGTLNVANPVTFTSLTVSNLFVTSGSITNLVNTSATSGSLKVTGVLDATTITTGSLNVSGTSTFQNVYIASTTQATDASSAALVVAGGIAAAKWVTANQFNAVSDVQFKTNIEPLHDSLSTIKRIEGYSYNWKDSYAPGEKRQIGVLAQQLEEIGLDDLVNNIGSSKSVNYIGIIPLLVEGIKELSEKVDRLDPSSDKKPIKIKIRKL
jgi:hypothetical protein